MQNTIFLLKNGQGEELLIVALPRVDKTYGLL